MSERERIAALLYAANHPPLDGWAHFLLTGANTQRKYLAMADALLAAPLQHICTHCGYVMVSQS